MFTLKRLTSHLSPLLSSLFSLHVPKLFFFSLPQPAPRKMSPVILVVAFVFAVASAIRFRELAMHLAAVLAVVYFSLRLFL